MGAEALRGDLDDLDGLRAAASTSDGVIHLAFKHDLAFTGGILGAMEAELRAVRAMGEALVGTEKPFVSTGGTLALAETVRGRAGTEADAGAGLRVASEDGVLAFATRGVRASVVRLAPTVHSHLDTAGFVPTLITLARKNGFAAYVGAGANVWPALHTLDAARLYRLALEKAAAGARLHGAAEEGVPFRAIAEAIGRGLGVPARSIAPEQASEQLGFLAAMAQAHNPTSSAQTRALLGFVPEHPGLLEDLAAGHYFARAVAA
jgi:nucleoside-diphosphate-sugar epimerase